MNCPDTAQAWLSVSSSEWVMNGSLVLNGARIVSLSWAQFSLQKRSLGVCFCPAMRVLGNTTWNQYSTININLDLNTASGYGTGNAL